MILIRAEKISKSFTERKLLRECSLSIHEGDKIGIIGVNGTGKSTLLKVIAGIDLPDSGTVTRSSGVRVAYLPQNPVFSEDATIIEQVMQGISCSQREAEEGKVRLFADEYQCKSILTKLGFSDFSTKVKLLSGGQKRRVSLACALACESEVLILDEPTNHIDSEMVDWLEKHLARYPGAILMVTHDRYFLDRVTNKIIELQNGGLLSYPANYSAYLELKAQREEMLLASERKRQSLYRRELDWIHQGAKARGTKSRYRIERLQELENQAYAPDQTKLDLSAASSRLGKKIIEIRSLCKSYDGRLLIQDFSYQLLRNDRLAFLGPNGCGKSTLLRMIVGTLAPDSGEVVLGDTVRIGYFSQEGEPMQPEQTAIGYIRSIAQEIETPDGMLTAAQMMEKFLFPSELQYTEIGRLSGGERRRLFLLRILIEAPNVLLLDEPTNDLDIETLSILEDYLESFPGAVIAVSHDRYFLDKVMNHVFVFTPSGKLHHYLGGYSDYRAEASQEETSQKEALLSEKSKKAKATRPRSEKLKFSFKEQKEYDEIDDVIAALEQKLADTQAQLEDQSSNYERLQELTIEKEEIEQCLSYQMERWVYLNDFAQQILQQSQSSSL